MKLWDLIVIGLIKMCTKFWQKKYQELPLLHAKPCLKTILKIPWDSRGIPIQGKLLVFTVFLGKSRVFMGIMGYIMVY